MAEADVAAIYHAAISVHEHLGLTRRRLHDGRPLEHCCNPDASSIDEGWKVGQDHNLRLGGDCVEWDQYLRRAG